MIYYLLSGSELVENCESYLPWVNGIEEHFIVKFSKEQSIEKLELIFIDMYKAKHEFSNSEYIQCEHIIKSNNPMTVVMSLNESTWECNNLMIL